MGSSLFLSILKTLLLLLSLFDVSNTSPSNFTRLRLCHDDERSALLQFRESFVIDPRASIGDPLAYPKVESWMLRRKQSGDCCSWDGVECDDGTGHVIGLDLSSSCLYGSIDSNSSLFRLVHLRKLNLATNHFNYSLIPSSFGHLSKLHFLNLSTSFFSGQIPSNVSGLSKLSSLDLSSNELTLKKPDFKSLIQNLTSLEVLHLNSLDISSTVPHILGNSSSLVSLKLRDCGLYGKFPSSILQLPRLEFLGLSSNPDLNGHIPEIHSSSPLRGLSISKTGFSGELPATIGNFNSLFYLDLLYSNFSGRFPSSLRNMTEIGYINLGHVPFDAQTTSSLSWFGQLTKLTTLCLNSFNLYGEIPSSFANLTQLSHLYLFGNQLTGSIPCWLMNLTQFVVLELAGNRLQGPIPMSISKLENLEILSLNYNNFSGTMELDIFLQLSKLTVLELSGISLSSVANSSSSSSNANFAFVALASCNLSVFPDFLRHQNKLQVLDLSKNKIYGQIPKWFFNSSDALWDLYLDGNFLTGDISQSFCNMTCLYGLSVRDNVLGGMLPSCLGDFSTSLNLLDLGRNNLHGTIPQTFTRSCKLQMIALDHNQLHGEVPRSLANCNTLELLNLGNNQIGGVFPSWLGALPNLKVLILRSNKLHGELKGHEPVFEFHKLHVIDLSRNNFSGQLPSQYFYNWEEMKMVKANQATYMKTIARFNSALSKSATTYSNWYSMSMTNKGTELDYGKILEFFVAIDLSGNRFEGDIPSVIGDLKRLHLLNLSNNILTGRIPSSLGNLMELEALDLSRNKLTGEIPQQLVQLNFLSVFNVSYNHLTGPVPQGKQFDTFLNDSYEGNLGLCGKVLLRQCASSAALPPASSSSEGDEDSDSLFGFGWKPVVLGYGCGLIVGLVIGHVVVTRKYDWFVKTFRIRGGQRRRRSRQPSRRRN